MKSIGDYPESIESSLMCSIAIHSISEKLHISAWLSMDVRRRLKAYYEVGLSGGQAALRIKMNMVQIL